MKTLHEAVVAMNERKGTMLSARGGPPTTIEVTDTHVNFSGVVEVDYLRNLLVGFDLDFDDVQSESSHLTRIAIECMHHSMRSVDEERAGKILADILRSLWIDGVAAGMMLAELRERDESSGSEETTTTE